MTGKPDPAAARALCDEIASDPYVRAVPALISHVRALADEVERLNGEINRRKGDPVTRLHNLCEGLEDVEPYGLEEWNRIDAENSELRERAWLAEAERDALLRVTRDCDAALQPLGAPISLMGGEMGMLDTGKIVKARASIATLPAALLAKVKGGEG